MTNYSIIKCKFKTYCFECNYTIWKNELIKYSGKCRHINCIKSLRDETPRLINPNYLCKGGKINKKDMILILKDRKKKSKNE